MADEEQNQDKTQFPSEGEQQGGQAGAEGEAQKEEGQAQDEGAEEFKDDGVEPQSFTQPNQAAAEGEGGDDDEVTPEDEKTIGKIVSKNIAPLQDQIFKTTVENELNSIYAQNPEYKPFDAKIRRFVNHPNRSGLIKQGALPVKTVVLEAIADHLPSISAQKSKAADAKANLAKDGGSQNRPTEAGNQLPDFSNMPSDDFNKVVEGVRIGNYKLPKS